MNADALKAALYLEAVLPAVPDLAAHDRPLAESLAGPDVSVALLAPGGLRARLAVVSGRAAFSTATRPGDLRLWFPSPGQLVRAFDGSGRSAFALPVGGFHRLFRAARLQAAGKRLETLLNTRADSHLALHAWGNLLVGVRAAAAWLRIHPADRDRVGPGVVVFACPALPAPLWLDTGALAAGVGDPPSAFRARVTFADLPVLLAELDHALDAPAALGLGTLHLEGHVPFAENVSLVMLKAGDLLKPG